MTTPLTDMFCPPVNFNCMERLFTGLHAINGELFCHKEKVETVPIETCVSEFQNWLEAFHRPILVCYTRKCDRFHFFLINTFYKYPVRGQLFIEGFLDSLHYIFTG